MKQYNIVKLKLLTFITVGLDIAVNVIMPCISLTGGDVQFTHCGEEGFLLSTLCILAAQKYTALSSGESLSSFKMPFLFALPLRVVLFLNSSSTLIQDGAEHGSRVASSEKTLQFFVCFICYFVVLCVGCC